jgi:hypothetical protein
MSNSIDAYKPNFGNYNYDDSSIINRLSVSSINPSHLTKSIIDSIYDYNPNDSKIIIDLIKDLDFTQRQFFTFSRDPCYAKYNKYIMRDFMSPFIDNITKFQLFKDVIDYILSKIEFKYIELLINDSILNDIIYRLFTHQEYDLFIKYFDYFSDIGLFNPKNGDYYLNLVYVLYDHLSEPEVMFSRNINIRKTFIHILSKVPAFKIFFSKVPLSLMPFDHEYIQMAYCYGLNIHCDFISKTIPIDCWGSYNYDILPTEDILQFLYLAGRDARKDLLRIGLNSKVLLNSLVPNEYSNFLKYIELYDSNDYKNLIDSKIEMINEYYEFKYRLNYSQVKTIKSINVILDFARLTDIFPLEIRLTDHQISKKYSVHSKDVVDETNKNLKGILPDHLIGLILSF